jgi:hypothetical protein
MYTSCLWPPSGLEQLHYNNDVRFVIFQMKQERVNELGKIFPDILQAHEPGALAKVVVGKLMSARPGVERNRLLDIVVLILAGDNKCSNRIDFDDALEDMFGEQFDAIWRSRVYGSVYHTLRLHGIPCFDRRKIRHGSKKLRSDVIGPMLPASLVWLGGAEQHNV